jgi:chromosomal replication initiation ATPase DnaA
VGWTLKRILRKAAEETGVKVEDLQKKSRNNAIAKAKSLAAYLAFRKLGLTRQEVARRLDVSHQAVSLLVRKSGIAPEADDLSC